MGKRTYTDKKRDEAVVLSYETTIQEAADELNIPFGTIACWRHKRRQAGDAGEEPTNGQEGDGRPGQSPETEKSEDGSEESRSGPEDELEQSNDDCSQSEKVARRYTPSEKAEALEYAAEHSVTEAARKLGACRQSIYRWMREKERADEGEADDPTEGPDPREMKRQRDREILNLWEKHPGLGPSQISNQLRRRGVKVSVQTTRRVMEDAGYRPEKVERREHDERFESLRPNHLWHLDFVHRHIHAASAFTLILLDDHSRFVTGFGVDDAERVDTAIEVLEEALRRHGRPEMVMTDRGSAFWSWRGVSRFTRLLEEMGIDQIAVENKEVNGKVEAFNGNLHTELLDETTFDGVDDLRSGLAEHIWWYNHRRTHHALGGVSVPADRFYGRVDEVMARIENGSEEPLDSLQTTERAVDLFRVTSQGGQPEVWLFGEKLYPPEA